MSSEIADPIKLQKPSFSSIPSSATYDHLQGSRWKRRTAAGGAEEKYVMLARKTFHGVCSRQSTVPRLLDERTLGTSGKAALRFLDNGEGQQFVERVHGEEESEQKIKVSKALPSSLKRERVTNEMGRGVSVPL